MHDDGKKVPIVGVANQDYHNYRKYLVYESVGKNRNNMRIVRGDDIFQVIQEAKENGCPIVVCKLGECVIDWS